MNINELKQALDIVTKNGGVPFITAQPGVGKSDSVRQFAEAKAKELELNYYEGPENYNPDGFGFIDLRLATVDSIDLGGLPLIDRDADVTRFTRSPYIPQDGHGILFLDELPQAKAGNQAAVSQLILDKRVGSHSLGENWNIIAAGNRAKDRAATHKMPTHIANRLTALELDFSIEVFIEYMHEKKVDDVAIAFAKFRPELLESFKPDQDINCTPRSYIAASNFITTAAENLQFSLMAGTIGEGATAEYLGFARIWKDLPPLSEFLKIPAEITIPTKSDVLYATIQMLAMNVTEKNADTINIFISRLEDSPEYVIMFWTSALKKCRKLLRNETFRAFLKENEDLIL